MVTQTTPLKRKKETFGRNFLVTWLRELSVGSKFSVIILLIIFVLLVEFGNFYFSMKTMSGIRIFIAGQDFWSKSQKDAHRFLVAYAASHHEADYAKITESLKIYQGDHNARLEMEKPNMNYQLVKEQLILGEIHPNDIDDAIFLFRTFRHISYLDRAIRLWTTGDGNVLEFLNVAGKVHHIISTPNNNNGTLDQGQELQISALMVQANSIDNELTILEKDYTTVLGEGSRAMKKILLWVTAILTLVLGMFVVSIAWIIQRITIQVDNAKNEFVSLASHQLRTPASAIKWYSEILSNTKTGELNEKQKSYLGEIHHGNERMLKLINNLLSVSRIEMGRFSVNSELVNPRKVLDDIIKEQQFEIVKRKQTITIYQNPDVIQFVTDPVLFAMILQNLVSNAVKYTLPNGHITCTLIKKDAKFLFGIKDDGIGIPDQEQTRIFEKLFRAKNAIDQNTEGNGLGLYIIKEIVAMLGGKISFESNLNEGTVFHIELPIKN